jgi:hypothetical protein
MSMDFYLPREQQAELREALHTVPALVEDLAVTITRQAHIGKNGLDNTRRPQPESRLPFHLAAAEAADDLHNTLATWVRFTSEHRRIHYRGHNDTTTLARWLARNITGLALTPGSEEAANDICTDIEYCRECIDLPPDDQILINPSRIDAANRVIVTAGQVDKLAHKLGELGDKLTETRIHTLNRGGHLRPVETDQQTGTKFYRLGDVLHAHTTCEKRNRKKLQR